MSDSILIIGAVAALAWYASSRASAASGASGGAGSTGSGSTGTGTGGAGMPPAPGFFGYEPNPSGGAWTSGGADVARAAFTTDVAYSDRLTRGQIRRGVSHARVITGDENSAVARELRQSGIPLTVGTVYYRSNEHRGPPALRQPIVQPVVTRGGQGNGASNNRNPFDVDQMARQAAQTMRQQRQAQVRAAHAAEFGAAAMNRDTAGYL